MHRSVASPHVGLSIFQSNPSRVPKTMSTDSPPSASAEKSPARSPLRRVLPWVAVLVLFPLLGWEFVSLQGHAQGVKKLIDLIGPPDDAPSRAISSKMVQDALRGKAPSVVEDVSSRNLSNGSSKVEVYRWFSLNPGVKRELFVYYASGPDPIAMCASAQEDLQTAAAPSQP